MLLIFDVVFMTDRVVDLFVGYKNPDGIVEVSLPTVISRNLSFKFF